MSPCCSCSKAAAAPLLPAAVHWRTAPTAGALAAALAAAGAAALLAPVLSDSQLRAGLDLTKDAGLSCCCCCSVTMLPALLPARQSAAGGASPAACSSSAACTLRPALPPPPPPPPSPSSSPPPPCSGDAGQLLKLPLGLPEALLLALLGLLLDS